MLKSKIQNIEKQNKNKINVKKVLLCISSPNLRLYEFLQLWSIEQWVSSLVGLILIYWLVTMLYNKRLLKYNLKMSFIFRFLLIFSDLAINLTLGLYYLSYRETIMGQLMIKCPIAISPIIFIIELLIIILIKENAIFIQNNKNSSKK